MVRTTARLVLVASLLFILLGFFAEAPRDHDRNRYILATLQVQALAQLVERYKADCGDNPSAAEGFNSLVLDHGVEGWHGPYLNELPVDPWRRHYIYLQSVASSMPEILSYGADGRLGGTLFAAEISSRDRNRSILAVLLNCAHVASSSLPG